MGVVAHGAALVHCLVLKNEGPGLVLMTLGATLILPRHGQTTRRFEDVAAVGIMAVNTAHVPLNHGMMLREIEFGLHIQMTLEAGFGIFAGIDDQAGGATGADMLAAGAVTGFATALAGQGGTFKVQSRMGTRGKLANNRGMTIGTSPVANKMGARNFQWLHHRGGGRGAGDQQKRQSGGQPQKKI